MKKRKIFSLTGARADYGRLKPVWKAIQAHPGLELIIAATGIHLLEKFGYTLKHLLEDGFKPDYCVDIFRERESDLSITKALGRGILELTEIINECKPDIVFVLGDRSEMLIPAIIGTHLNIPVAHMAGGFVTEGVVDEVVRHSLTKMSHIHFATSRDCAQRIIKMGEEEWRVHFVGSPAIDLLFSMKYETKETLFKRFYLDPASPLLIVTYHPVTTEAENSRKQVSVLIDALKHVHAQTIITYPNIDNGGLAIIEELEKLEGVEPFRIVKNLSTETYLNFLKYADLMVGNSSSGFIEAPYFYLPAINVGNRQMGRQKYDNIINVDFDAYRIADVIQELLHDRAMRERLKETFDYPYGNGAAGQNTAKILADVLMDRTLVQKKITF
ncbi:MAG: UDP-N-acetylglucosamine 2-epimerase (hydrolyzing) [Planctomycetes bacterium]|nr:UDP-N-acetylglucosamine 2-epimerase (hydrolyzing) [Planctomycetota bacterium]